MTSATNEPGTLAVGMVAPPFALASHEGVTVSLRDYRDRRGVVVYFMREFTCRQCLDHAATLARGQARFLAAATDVLVVGPRGAAAAALTARKIAAPFPILADPTRATYRAYGFTKSFWVIQQSGVVLVDRDGKVAYLHQRANPYQSLDESALWSAVER